MGLTPTWALVPVCGFARGKTRLGLPAADREAVARALFDHVMSVLASCPAIAGVVVATDGAGVAERAAAFGAHVVADGEPGPLRVVVDRGLAALAGSGAPRAVVLMGDLPLLGVGDVAAVARALQRSPAVVAPDLVERRTNGLGLRLADVSTTCFGRDSFRRHLGATAGLGPRILRRPGLAFDLDHPAQLRTLIGWAAPEAMARVCRQLGIAAEDAVRVAHTIQAIEGAARGVVPFDCAV